MAACWEPNSSSPSIAGQGVSQLWSPLPHPPGCTSPSLLRLPALWGICLLEPMEVSVSLPKRAGAEPGLRTGCMEPPKPQGSGEEGEASSWRRAPMSIFLLSSGPASFHSSAWDGDEPLREPPALQRHWSWLGCAAQQRGGALFSSSPLPYKHLCKNKMHFPGGSLEELTTVVSGHWPRSCPCMSTLWG